MLIQPSDSKSNLVNLMRKEVFEVQFPSVEFLLLAAVDCGGLDSPTNGTVRVTGTRFGSTATYTCSPGYVLTNGNKIRECGGNGEWSGTAPSCVRKLPYP